MNQLNSKELYDLLRQFLANTGISLRRNNDYIFSEAVMPMIKHKFRDKEEVSLYLDDLVREISEQGIGTAINFFPTEIKGACCENYLAIASLGFDSKYYPDKMASGFKSVILNAFKTWFSCSNVNKNSLIITADWNTAKFEEFYKPSIDAYTKNFNKKVEIYELSTTGLFLRYPY